MQDMHIHPTNPPHIYWPPDALLHWNHKYNNFFETDWSMSPRLIIHRTVGWTNNKFELNSICPNCTPRSGMMISRWAICCPLCLWWPKFTSVTKRQPTVSLKVHLQGLYKCKNMLQLLTTNLCMLEIFSGHQWVTVSFWPCFKVLWRMWQLSLSKALFHSTTLLPTLICPKTKWIGGGGPGPI